MDFTSLVREISDKESAITFLMSRGILHEHRECPEGHSMVLGFSSDRWRCNKSKCRVEIGLRKDTWLEKSKLPFDVIIFFIYAWANEYSTTKFCQKELKMSKSAITDWKNFLREVCANSLLQKPTVIGGRGLTVEIDLWCFSKNKNDDDEVQKQWIFGGICRENNECFMFAITDRTSSTLHLVLRECIRPGTTIISNMNSDFDKVMEIPGMDFKHLRIEKSRNFVDPITGAHTQNIKSLWALAKLRNVRECGTSHEMLDSYICEFVWRYRNRGKDMFEQIIKDIKALCPLKKCTAH